MIEATPPPGMLLTGIVGSTAYGLAGPDSDVDRLGVFAAPTLALVGLRTPPETYVTTKPDSALHEAGKYCHLALAGNPTATELMWLPEDLYEVRTPLGDALRDIRRAFLSAPRVRDAYLGYATQQFKRLAGRGDGTFSSDTRRRTAKHARHLLRLCHQGLTLYTTGELEIRLSDPEHFRDFGERVAAGDIDAARRAMTDYEAAFAAATPAVPPDPDEQTVAAWLRDVRVAHWSEHDRGA